MGLETRSTDATGRISLPKAFADSMVIIEQASENELRIREAGVIPEDEMRFVEETSIVLSERDRQQFSQALDEPPNPNTALRGWMASTVRSAAKP